MTDQDFTRPPREAAEPTDHTGVDEGRLDDRAFEALRCWATDSSSGVADGFAERVLERLAAQSGETETETETAAPVTHLGAERRRRWPIALAVAAIAAAAVLVLVPSGSGDGSPLTPDAPTDAELALGDDAAYAVLQQDARRLLAQRCVPCHDASHRDGIPAALDVFDVSVEADGWAPTLSESQLRFSRERLVDDGAVASDELDRFDAFVEGQLVRR